MMRVNKIVVFTIISVFTNLIKGTPPLIGTGEIYRLHLLIAYNTTGRGKKIQFVLRFFFFCLIDIFAVSPKIAVTPNK